MAKPSQPARSRPARPQPATAVPPRLSMLLVAVAFGALAVVAVVATVTTGALAMLVNAVMAAAISAMFAMVALRQRIDLNRQGLAIHGFGSMGRQIRWKDVERFELTDAGRFRLGPRLIVRGG